MNLKNLFNSSEDGFPLLEEWKSFYGPFGLDIPESPKDRPYISSNFVTGIDGRASFRELSGRAGGKEVSRSEVDRWLFNFLLAHHEAGIVGADTLRSERGPDGLGWDLHIEPEELVKYRHDVLKFKKQVVIVLSGSGNLDLNFKIFNSEKVETWIVTSAVGAEALNPQISKRNKKPTLIEVGKSAKINMAEMLRVLRQKYGIRTLHCLGGPSLHGQLIKEGLLDESFLTVSAQVLGESTNPDIKRPTAFGKASFIPESAPWFQIVSVHYEPLYHIFLRLRRIGPRRFSD